MEVTVTLRNNGSNLKVVSSICVSKYDLNFNILDSINVGMDDTNHSRYIHAVTFCKLLHVFFYLLLSSLNILYQQVYFDTILGKIYFLLFLIIKPNQIVSSWDILFFSLFGRTYYDPIDLSVSECLTYEVRKLLDNF